MGAAPPRSTRGESGAGQANERRFRRWASVQAEAVAALESGYLPLAGGSMVGTLTLDGTTTAKLQYTNTNSGNAEVAFEDDYLRYRFGGTATPKGIRIDDYDSVRTTLNRDGTVVFTNKLFIRSTEDASLTADSGTLILGNSGGNQMALDYNEILARTAAGAAATLNLNLTGGVVRTSAEGIQFVDANTYIKEGDDNRVRLGTDHGYLDIGALNTGGVHIQSDTANIYWYNQITSPTHSNLGSTANYWGDIHYSGVIRSHAGVLNIDQGVANTDLYLRTHNGTAQEPRIGLDGDADNIYFYDHDGIRNFKFWGDGVSSNEHSMAGPSDSYKMVIRSTYAGFYVNGWRLVCYTTKNDNRVDITMNGAGVGIQHTNLPTYNNVNGSMRWMGTNTDMGQAHTSSSQAYKRNMSPIHTRGRGKVQPDGQVSQTGSIFDRLDTTYFEYAEDHPHRGRWLGRRVRPEKVAELDALIVAQREDTSGNLLVPDKWDDEFYEDADYFAEFETPAIGRMGFIYEQVAEEAPHFAYLADGMEAVAYEGMLPDFMAWAVATIRDLRDRVDQLEVGT